VETQVTRRAILIALAGMTLGARTHDDVLRDIGARRRPAVRAAVEAQGLAYPPPRLTLVGLKEERVLEVWAPKGAGWTRVRAYPVLAASGTAGPKLREGDLQVPEGVYRLTGFNPNSSYHLSVRVDYPNADDRAVARGEGRTGLGGDIFIHGKAVSIGCLAIGDGAIEELYTLLADVGLTNARLVLAPSAAPAAARGTPAWIAGLYDRLRRELRAVRG
jgi:murein L,D-transpeptidase YafK